MSDLINLLRTAARVKRLHTVPTIREQSVGEHTFGVLGILHLMGVVLNESITLATLLHDVPEAITGDVPAPAKKQWPALDKALLEAEEEIAKDFGFISVYRRLAPNEKRAIQFADSMECALYGYEEALMGNTWMVPVAYAALDAIRQNSLLEVAPNSNHIYDTVATALESKFPREDYSE